MGQVTVTLLQPAALGTGVRKAGVQHTEEYLTGTVLRGALAARWLARHGEPLVHNPRRDEFVRLFESGVVFGPLLPPGAVPMPISCLVHKYDPLPGCLLWWDEALGAMPPDGGCPGCGDPLERAKGQLRTVHGAQLRPAVHTVEDTHPEVGDDDRVVDGQLFTRRRLGRGQSFTGFLHGTDTDLDLITREASPLWLGGRRSTAGRAALTHQLGAIPSLPEQPDQRHLVLRLAAPGIFVDRSCRPLPEPGPEELSRVLGVAAQVRRRWMRWTQVTGWHAASGYPKPAERAAAAGSTYLVSCAEPPSPDALADLAARGVGLRRIEGYGALSQGPDLILGPLLVATEAELGEQEAQPCASH